MAGGAGRRSRIQPPVLRSSQLPSRRKHEAQGRDEPARHNCWSQGHPLPASTPRFVPAVRPRLISGQRLLDGLLEGFQVGLEGQLHGVEHAADPVEDPAQPSLIRWWKSRGLCVVSAVKFGAISLILKDIVVSLIVGLKRAVTIPPGGPGCAVQASHGDAYCGCGVTAGGVSPLTSAPGAFAGGSVTSAGRTAFAGSSAGSTSIWDSRCSIKAKKRS